jgi:hypothetical protein
MKFKATKEFEVEEGSTDNMWYKITVKFRGTVVDEFLTPTQREARLQFEAAGYKTV